MVSLNLLHLCWNIIIGSEMRHMRKSSSFSLQIINCAGVMSPSSSTQCCTVSLTGSERPLGPARRIKRPPHYPTRCPYWDGFRWSQRAARERSESHSGLNWTHHETGSGCRSVQRRPARRQGLFQLRLTLAERGITTGFRVAGHIWTQHMVSQSAPTDYMARIWQTCRLN